MVLLVSNERCCAAMRRRAGRGARDLDVEEAGPPEHLGVRHLHRRLLLGGRNVKTRRCLQGRNVREIGRFLLLLFLLRLRLQLRLLQLRRLLLASLIVLLLQPVMLLPLALRVRLRCL